MYTNKKKPIVSSVKINNSKEGESIEKKVERITTNKEPIKDGADTIYSNRVDGIMPGTNIRTDRFEIAAEAMDKVTGSKIAKREEFAKKLKEDNDKLNPDEQGGTQ
jgi:hypothetical protein